jgi:flavin reductase (DIM6/NTAB) family NADH-FMN oxidoreductase RutF
MNEDERNASVVVQPKILYYGTPAILVSTRNADGTANLSPMSSSWALGDHVVLGMLATGQGLENLTRERECVINVPDPAMWRQVETLAPTTGRADVPAFKRAVGYRYEPDKFGAARLTEAPSDTVRPPRIAECPLQLEAKVVALHETPLEDAHDMGGAEDGPRSFTIVDTRVTRVHAHARIVVPGTNHIDPGAWSPLLYVFRHYFGTGKELGKTFKAEG